MTLAPGWPAFRAYFYGWSGLPTFAATPARRLWAPRPTVRPTVCLSTSGSASVSASGGSGRQL